MQSKISSFKLIDKTIFKKNLKRCWPLYIGYAFVVMWLLPLTMYFDRMMSYYQDKITLKKRITAMILSDTLPIGIWIAMAMGIFMAMAMFSYLQNERACSFIHSLPIKRETLYSTGFITGAMMMITSNIVAYVFALIVCAGYGVNCVSIISTWLLIISLEELFFFSFGCLCMISMGNTIFAGIMYVIFQFIADILMGPVNSLYQNMYMGVSGNLVTLPENWLRIISPYEMFYQIDYTPIYENEIVVDYKLAENIPGILIETFIFTVIFIFLGFIFNKIRKSEQAGEFIALKFLRPIFRWGLGIVVGLLLSTLMMVTLFDGLKYTNAGRVMTAITIVIFAFVGYISAQMLMKKSFRIFKGIWKELCIFIAVVILGCIVMIFAGKKMTKYVPDKEDVDRIYFQLGGIGSEFSDDKNVADILKIHRDIIDNYDELIAYYKSYDSVQSVFYVYITEYVDNRVINRVYSIPGNLTDLYNEIKLFINSNTKKMILGGLKAENADKADIYISNDNNEFGLSHISLSRKNAQQLHLALEKDIDEGNLDFWTAKGFLMYNDDKGIVINENDYQIKYDYDYQNQIEFSYYYDLEDNNGMQYTAFNYLQIYFDENCTNVIDFLTNCDEFIID